MTPHGFALLLASAVLLPAALFAALPAQGDQLALFSQYLGTVALGLMAWAQVWATRLPGIETVFGPLDRVYVLHKWSAIVALVTMLAHDTIDADMRGLSGWPLTDLGETLGEISLYGIIALSVISIITFVPYHLWKWTHKFMGAFFVAGAAHTLMIEKPFSLTDPLGLYMFVVAATGTLAYVLTLLPRRAAAYVVETVEQTGGATAVTLAPKGGRNLAARPGQFVSVAFASSDLAEPHPFTLSAPVGADGRLQVTVKPLGDYTARLASDLTPGDAANVTGPYGRFTRRDGTKPETWVAAGIGITPFLSWAEALDDQQTGQIHLIWAIRSADEAPHLARVQAAAVHPALTLTLIDGSMGDRLTSKRVAEITGGTSGKMHFCGPTALRRALSAEGPSLGLPRRIHFEAFEFRTGLGLRRLLAWVKAKLPASSGARPGLSGTRS